MVTAKPWDGGETSLMRKILSSPLTIYLEPSECCPWRLQETTLFEILYSSMEIEDDETRTSAARYFLDDYLHIIDCFIVIHLCFVGDFPQWKVWAGSVCSL